MKCAKASCQKNAVPMQKYCSKECAPYGTLVDRSTELTKTARSIFKEDGEKSPQSSVEEKPKPTESEKNTEPTPLLERISAVRAITPDSDTSSESVSDADDTGSRSLQPFENQRTEIDLGEVLKTGSKESQLLAFVAPSPDSDEAKLPSGNLIDSTLMHLHGLMRTVAKDAPEYQKRSPEMINAVCNTAKQMRDLMRLKLDIHRATREKE